MPPDNIIERTQTLAESRLRGTLPTGFQSTQAASDRLRELANADVGILNEIVEDYGQNVLTERDVVRSEIQRVMTAFQTPERTLELPATGLEFENIQRFVADYKDDNDTPSGTVKDERRVNTDDLLFTFATPEVYARITDNTQSTFKNEGLSGGTTLDVVGDAGLSTAGNTNGASLNLDDDERLYFTGDFIDVSTGKSAITKIQWKDIDGRDYGPDNGFFSNRLSGTHLFSGQGAYVKSTADLDAKVYESANAEIVPVAFYVAPGTKAPDLV
jgi:hypothetical protein